MPFILGVKRKYLEKLPEIISRVYRRVGFKKGSKVEVLTASGEMRDLFFRITCKKDDIISNEVNNLPIER